MAKIFADRQPLHFICDGIGLVLLFVGLFGTLYHFYAPIFAYDEGFLLTHSDFILAGKIPFKDFYTPYPPGILFILAGFWKIFGVNPLIERALGTIVHFIIVFASGYIVSLVSNRFSLLCAGLVAIWLVPLGCAPYTWLCALAITLIACIAFLKAERTRGKLIAGILVGAISWFRQDIFVYFSLGLILIYIGSKFAKRIVPDSPFIERPGYVIIGAIFSSAIFWIPIVSFGGFEQLLADIFLDQIQFVQPARKLPFPPILEFRSALPLTFQIPIFLSDITSAGNVLIFAAPVIAVIMLLSNTHTSAKGRFGLSLLIILGSLSLFYLFVRNDFMHVLFSVIPALIIIAVFFERLNPNVNAGTVCLLLGISWLLIFPVRMQFLRPTRYPIQQWQTAFPRYAGLPEPFAERKELLAFISENTKEDQSIYIGLTNHENVVAGETDLYFLSARLAATRYASLEPNLVNREDVQQAMIAEIKQKDVKLIVLSSRYEPHKEQNQSSKRGTTILDEFFKQNYVTIKIAGAYKMLWRNSDPHIPNVEEKTIDTDSSGVLEFAKSPSNAAAGQVSLHRVASVLAGAVDIEGSDLFDVSRAAGLFPAGSRRQQYDHLRHKEKEGLKKTGYRKHFHDGLVRTAIIILLVEQSAENNSVPPLDEFLTEFRKALESIDQAGDTGKPIATHLHKLHNLMDLDENGQISKEEAEEYLKKKLDLRRFSL